MDSVNTVDSILEQVVDPGVRNALIALFEEVDAANTSASRMSAAIRIIVEVQDLDIELPGEESANFADPGNVCTRNGKTPITIRKDNQEVTICCPGDPDCPTRSN